MNTMNDTLTYHATKRLNQRGIHRRILNYLLENGRAEYAPGGAIKISITRRDADQAISSLKKKISLIENATNKVIIEKDGKIITIYHQIR